jgi:hypothetical protein
MRLRILNSLSELCVNPLPPDKPISVHPSRCKISKIRPCFHRCYTEPESALTSDATFCKLVDDRHPKGWAAIISQVFVAFELLQH